MYQLYRGCYCVLYQVMISEISPIKNPTHVDFSLFLKIKTLKKVFEFTYKWHCINQCKEIVFKSSKITANNGPDISQNIKQFIKSAC